MKLTLDLHDIYNRGTEIEKALQQKFDEAVAKKAPLIEIIPGKGSGQLKKHVLRFLEPRTSSRSTTGSKKIRRTSAACSCISAGNPRTVERSHLRICISCTEQTHHTTAVRRNVRQWSRVYLGNGRRIMLRCQRYTNRLLTRRNSHETAKPPNWGDT